MSLKGTVKAGHIPRNKYKLQINGIAVPEVTFISVSSFEEEIEEVLLPDRTRASGGQKPPLEFTVRVPSHHDTEIAAMDAWYVEGQDTVTATYKKTGVLSKFDIHGSLKRSYTLTGLWNRKRVTDELAFENTGEMDSVEYTLSADEVVRTT